MKPCMAIHRMFDEDCKAYLNIHNDLFDFVEKNTTFVNIVNILIL